MKPRATYQAGTTARKAQNALATAIGSNVRRLREEQKLTKQTFALMLGIGRPTLDKIEKGEADLRLSLLCDLAEALSVTPEDLIGMSL